MIGLVVSAVLPGSRHRTIAAEHPYTDDGREVEVLVGEEWVELLECGLAGGHVLRAGGLDPERWSGLALGLGLDRALMLRKGIGDIRLLRTDDPRVAAQMLDLDRYQEVSSMPATRRDLSIAVAADVTAEELGDRVRDSLEPGRAGVGRGGGGRRRDAGGRLPPQAIARIGLRPGQKNVLVRLVLRHPTRTLTAAEANQHARRRLRGDPRGLGLRVGGPEGGAVIGEEVRQRARLAAEQCSQRWRHLAIPDAGAMWPPRRRTGRVWVGQERSCRRSASTTAAAARIGACEDAEAPIAESLTTCDTPPPARSSAERATRRLEAPAARISAPGRHARDASRTSARTCNPASNQVSGRLPSDLARRPGDEDRRYASAAFLGSLLPPSELFFSDFSDDLPSLDPSDLLSDPAFFRRP